MKNLNSGRVVSLASRKNTGGSKETFETSRHMYKEQDGAFVSPYVVYQLTQKEIEFLHVWSIERWPDSERFKMENAPKRRVEGSALP